MYESFFGLQQEPFSIAPDPRFLYMSDKHRDALALLNHGLSRGASFVLLTGEIGAGKTTVWRRFLEQLPSNFDVANVVNPRLGITALLTRICDDLRVPLPEDGSAIDLIDLLHGHLLLAHAQGRRTLIVIDEAQALSTDVLEQLRLLTNLDASGRKLQVMLIGQPELRQILQRPQLEPLAQRVVARYHLPTLSAVETVAYIDHRLKVAGLTGPLPFDGEALAAVHRLCRGVPRRINVLCDRSMIAAFASGRRQIDAATVAQAAAETLGEGPATAPPPAPAARKGLSPGLAFAGVAAIALAAGVLLGPRLWANLAPAPRSAATMVAAAVAPAPAVPVPAPAAPASRAAAAAALPFAPQVPLASMPLPSLEAAFSPAAADESLAWRNLAGLWGATLGPGEPCAMAALKSLQCFRGRGGLALLGQLGRPSILRLVDDQGRVAHVLLTGIADDSVLMVVAGVERHVALVHLARLWRGDFATFWKVPPGYGDGAGASARWLAEHLDVIDHLGPVAGGEQDLRARVYAFQLSHGLAPDGVAGPLTLMQMNRMSGVAEPALKGLTSGSRPS